MEKIRFALKIVLILVLILFTFKSAYGQERTIEGKVTTSDLPGGVPGANIFIKGTSKGTISDVNGNYSIQAATGDILVCSFIGYTSLEKEVEENVSVINFQLEEDLVGLDEVVVIGYGTIEKSDLTGSVSSVKAEELTETATTNIGEMLRGKVAGLEVNLETARPGGSSSILIRGRNSLSGGNNPLFIVDGAPAEGINDLNAQDIASIEVLKDASAQAVYGARASNGVILITTKRGKAGKIGVSYSNYVGVQQIQKNFELYNGPEWAEMRRQAVRSDLAPQLDDVENWREFLPDDVIFDSKMLEALQNEEYVDWEELVLREAWMQKHDISISGGSEKTRFATSFGYFDQDGVIPTSGYKRGTFRFNFDQKINDWLSFGANSFITRSDQDVETEDRNFIIQPPLSQPYDDQGKLQMDITNDVKHYNPLLNLYESSNNRKRTNLNLTFFTDIIITDFLKYKFNSSINSLTQESAEYLSTEHSIGRRLAEGSGKGGEARLGSYDRFEYLIENILDFQTDIGGIHSLSGTLMQGINQINSQRYSITAQNFTDDILGYNGIGNATTILPMNNNAFGRAMISYMARAQYGYDDRYMITLTGRIDGSSVFGPNNKYAFFPSVALAWRLDQENFLSGLEAVSSLKLRASYGLIGNEAIQPYTTLGLTENRSYTFGDNDISVGYLPGSNDFPNYNLRWESSATSNLGLDFALFNGRISGTVDAYKISTYDLLVSRQVPSTTGYTRVLDNLGETQNTGIEAVLSTHVISTNNFSWIIDATFSRNRNKIISISGEVDDEGNPVDDIANNWFIGEPINVYYDYKFDGIWQKDDDILNSHMPFAKPGHVRVTDINGDTLLTPGDDRVIIERDADWIGSFGTTIRYKAFELSADLYIVQGLTRLNNYLYNFNYGGLVAHFNGVKRDYWTPEDPSNTVPRVYLDNTSSLYKSTSGYQDASYIRLRNLTLGYNVPEKVLEPLKIERLRVYLTSNNLFTITDYKSYSPEVTPSGYPENRSFLAGINVTF
ncbi:MAG: SusC/RagA family TonB-linked outer membrane protein [Bacteroidales bacterium]